jgi:hypothetical protein
MAFEIVPQPMIKKDKSGKIIKENLSEAIRKTRR